MDDIEILEARQYQIGQALQEAETKELVDTLIEELAEVTSALDHLLVGVETWADARREARYGVQL